jgi:hypothetical protein
MQSRARRVRVRGPLGRGHRHIVSEPVRTCAIATGSSQPPHHRTVDHRVGSARSIMQTGSIRRHKPADPVCTKRGQATLQQVASAGPIRACRASAVRDRKALARSKFRDTAGARCAQLLRTQRGSLSGGGPLEDYRRAVGHPPARIVRVWLIAVSLFQRHSGESQFADIELVTDSCTVELMRRS